MTEGDENGPIIERADLDNIVYISAIVGIIGSIALFVIFVATEWGNPQWSLVFHHFPATIGLPFAAAASFIIIALFRSTEGQIKFSGLGFNFEGASGPIVMWVLCFLAIAVGIKLLWPLTLAA
ncbi:hypothetical protein [Bradyrhizobium amphicarpaeae]|uniref:Uncharacterized protein n=1 Tax=Bradyrhizobium amphicarpaeae TaxID=1404768 RepID=A0A2U8PPM0_9BRAD|nr:hypothetical protein [Bradyrhizobium amphicarpaeae]AWL99580.1 hypothetical protein CIT40_05750 [Bradyrhizobium amphicarpaeae]